MRRLLSLTFLLALFTFAACGDDDGGGDKKSADEYAKAACAAVADWVGSIQEGSQKISGQLGANATPSEGKKVLQDFLGDAVTASDKFAKDVDAAGVPDVDGGEKFADSLKKGAAAAKEVMEDAKAKADDLSTSNVAAFSKDARELGSSTNKALSEVGDAISDPSSDDLKKALQEDSSCKGIGTS